MYKVLHLDVMRQWRGGERQALLLAEGSKNRGIDVLFICRKNSVLQEKLVEAGVPTMPLSIPFEADFYTVWRLSRIIRENRFDIIHTHDSHSLWLGGCAGLLARRGVRIAARRVDFSIHRHGFGLSYFKYRYFTDHIIAVSEAVKEVLIKDGVPPSQISVIYSGVKTEPPQKTDVRTLLNLSADTRVVGTVGALVPHKGHRHLIEAAAMLIPHRRNLHFVIIGEGPLKKSLIEQAHYYGVSPNVHFLGFRKDAENLIPSFDLFVMSSVEEGLGTVVLDAYRAGVCVVATDAGGLKEVVEDGVSGIRVGRGSGSELKRRIARILDDEEMRKNLIEGGRIVLKSRFSADIMIEKTLSLYKRLLEDTQ
ncbi:MAG: glycosyltransferase [Planctomycetota bacterium]|nr:glycosyltransferase [Planctomycetota bacterium]